MSVTKICPLSHDIVVGMTSRMEYINNNSYSYRTIKSEFGEDEYNWIFGICVGASCELRGHNPIHPSGKHGKAIRLGQKLVEEYEYS